MEQLFKSIDIKTIESQFGAAVDQAEKSASGILTYVQPDQVRDTLTTLNKAYFDFARTSMTNAKTFGLVVEKVSKEFTKNFEKATKVA
jgi:hypothetical protein